MAQNPARGLSIYTAYDGEMLTAEQDAYNRDRETLMKIDDPLERARFFMLSECCPREYRGDITAIAYWLREKEGWTREQVDQRRLAIVGLMKPRGGESDRRGDATSFATARRG